MCWLFISLCGDKILSILLKLECSSLRYAMKEFDLWMAMYVKWWKLLHCLLTLWHPLLPYGYSYKASLGWASECPDVKNYKWWFNPVWRWILHSCTHMATDGIKGLIKWQLDTSQCLMRLSLTEGEAVKADVGEGIKAVSRLHAGAHRH